MASPPSPRAVGVPGSRPLEARILMLVVLVVAALSYSLGTMVAGRPSVPAAAIAGVLFLVLIWSTLPVLLSSRRRL